MKNDGIETVIGVDLGDKHSDLFVIHRNGGECERMRVPTTAVALKRLLGGFTGKVRTTIEAGTHSPWVSRLLEDLGHEVVVANPRMLRLIYADNHKDDETDCEKLASLADYNKNLLSPVEHRESEFQTDLAVVRARDVVVSSRTKLINHVRGVLKSNGTRAPTSSAGSFTSKVRPMLPEALGPALFPLLDQIDGMTTTIRAYDKQVLQLNAKHVATAQLRQIPGVGPLTALAFVLILANPLRFKRSRDVGSYVGLTTRRSQSGGCDPELRITKSGDRLLRKLLVQSAQYILGPFGSESDLRTWGLALAKRGKKNAKKRAVVAVARKLSVLLHRLWITGKPYEPLRANKTPPEPVAESNAIGLPQALPA